MKKYLNATTFYTLIALIMGVFYREFTKFNHFEMHTSLAVVHSHYLILGTFFFLILVILEKQFDLSQYVSDRLVKLYHVGLNLTCLMMVVRGVVQVLNLELSRAFDASLAGVAGIGHIVLSLALILLLVRIRKAIINPKEV